MPRQFQFSLQSVLRVRETHEREAKRRVGAKLAEIARVDARLHELEAAIAGAQAKLREEQQESGLDVATLTLERAWIAHLRRGVAQEGRQRALLQQELAPLQAAMRLARQQTRMIEKLRERRWSEHVHGEAVREQRELDDLARELLTRNEAGRKLGDRPSEGADRAD